MEERRHLHPVPVVGPWVPWCPEQSLGFVLQVDEVTDLLASFTSLSLQMQNMEKR